MYSKQEINVQALRSSIEEKNWSIEDLARRAGLSRQTVFRILKGDAQPSGRSLLRIATALGIEPGALIENQDPALASGFAGLLKRLRLREDLSQELLASRAGISRMYLRDLETGRRAGASVRVVEGLASALRENPQVLFEAMGRTKGRRLPENKVDSIGAGRESGRLALKGFVPNTPRDEGEAAPDFAVSFSPEFSPPEVKAILTALANYYRGCGGVGFKVKFDQEEAVVEEPVHA